MPLRPFDSLSLRFDGERLELLDQRRLPDEERWLECSDPFELVALIRELAVRGAPLLGVAAAVCLGRYADSGVSEENFERAAQALRTARPTAVNLMATVDRLRTLSATVGLDAVGSAAMEVFDEDVALSDALADHGAELLANGDSVLTHCNTGGLATVGVGTALGVIRRACENGKKLHVWVDETRPLLQGARLTAWELSRLGIAHTVITDSMAAVVLRSEKVSRVLVGADRIAKNGDFANKIGTYGLAVLARFHGVPFHPVAPSTTVDLGCADGGAIEIEQRHPGEVRGARGAFGVIRWAPESSPGFNPAFDVTPVELVTSLVLDRGVVSREALSKGALSELGVDHASRNGRKTTGVRDFREGDASGDPGARS